MADVRGEQHPPHGGWVTHVIKVRIDDLEEQYARVRAHDARILEEPVEHEYGERDFMVEDPGGHRLQFTQTMRDMAPEEYGCQTVNP